MAACRTGRGACPAALLPKDAIAVSIAPHHPQPERRPDTAVNLDVSAFVTLAGSGPVILDAFPDQRIEPLIGLCGGWFASVDPPLNFVLVPLFLLRRGE